MLVFTKYKMLYAFIACFFFGVTIGSFAFVSRVDTLCPTYMKNGTSGLCYVAIGAGSAGIAGVLWPFLPTFMHLYISVMATMTTGYIFNIQMAIVAFAEMMKAVQHLQRVTMIPLDVAECLKEETAYSIQLVRRSMFSESHVDDMNQGIKEVADSFDKVQRAQDRFRDAIERGFRWLESKGYSCRQTLQLPYANCLKDIAAQGEVQAKFHYAFICNPLKFMSTAACDRFSEERITEALLVIRDKIAEWISAAVVMRVGILFELHSTGYVGEELANAWAPFKAALKAGSDIITFLYYLTTEFILQYMGFFALIFYPPYYIIYYNCGPFDFDNKYIPGEEEDKEQERTDEDTPDDLRYLPLQYGNEANRLQMIRAWIPRPEQIVTFVTSLVMAADLVVHLVILVIDFYYTKLVDGIYFGSIHMFNRYQGNIFDINREPYAHGLRYLGQIMLEQLDRLQQASGFGRMVACARHAPPIDYTYEVFLVAVCYRLFFLLSLVMLAWLPSTICARFNPHRHRQRMRAIKAETLLYREGYEPPSMCPWFRHCWYSFTRYFTLAHWTPRWMQLLFQMNVTADVY